MKPQNSYSQCLDSLQLKELNEELLKGIQARERVVQLKKIITTDSLTIALYKDSIIPSYDTAIKVSKDAIIKLNSTIEDQNLTITGYRYLTIILSILNVLLII